MGKGDGGAASEDVEDSRKRRGGLQTITITMKRRFWADG